MARAALQYRALLLTLPATIPVTPWISSTEQLLFFTSSCLQPIALAMIVHAAT